MDKKAKLEKELERLRKEFEKQRCSYNDSVEEIEEKLRELENEKNEKRLKGYLDTLVHYVDSWDEGATHYEWHMIGYVDKDSISGDHFYLENSVDIMFIDGAMQHTAFRKNGDGGHSITSDLDKLLKNGTCEYVDEYSVRKIKHVHTLCKTTLEKEKSLIEGAFVKEAEKCKKYVLERYVDATMCFSDFENSKKI